MELYSGTYGSFLPASIGALVGNNGLAQGIIILLAIYPLF